MKSCFLCLSNELNTLRYGELLTNEKMSVHYFCLLFTSMLLQSGKDNEGFLGFLPNDIIKEANRIRKNICTYCGKESANIGCCKKKCRKSFHFICGIKNNAINIFHGTYQSFCNRHIPFTIKKPPSPKETCSICYEELGRFSKVNILNAPCCKNGWFHKDCLLNFSKNAGYFFKCPLCNNTSTFRDQLAKKGIFIPDQDAAWELEPNAFAELLERPSTCSAPECNNRYGRNSKTSKLVMCNTCGSQAIHTSCMTKPGDPFFCSECMVIEMSTSKPKTIDLPLFATPNDESEEIDVVNTDVRENSSDDEIDIKPKLINRKRRFVLDNDSDSSSDCEGIIKPVTKRIRQNRLLSDNSISSDLETGGSKIETSVDTKEMQCSETMEIEPIDEQSDFNESQDLNKKNHSYRLRKSNSCKFRSVSQELIAGSSKTILKRRRTVSDSYTSNAFNELSSNESKLEKPLTVTACINITRNDLNKFDSNGKEKYDVYEDSINNNTELDDEKQNTDANQYKYKNLNTKNCEILKDIRDTVGARHLSELNHSHNRDVFNNYFRKNSNYENKNKCHKLKKFKKTKLSPLKLFVNDSRKQSRIDMFFKRV